MGDKNNHRQLILLRPTAGVSSSSKVPLSPLPKHLVSPSHPRQVQGEVPGCCPMGLQQEHNIQPAVLTSLQCPAMAQLPTDPTALLCIQHSYPLLSCSCAPFPSCLTYTSSTICCHSKGTEVSGSKQQAQPTVEHSSCSRKCFSSKKDLVERQESAGNITHTEQMPLLRRHQELG